MPGDWVHSGRRPEHGAALMLVLWTLSVLSVLAGQYALAMRREAEVTRTFKQETLGHYTAMAGLNEAILAIYTYNGELDIEDDEPDDASASDTAPPEEEEEDESLKLIRRLVEGRGEWVEAWFNGAPYELRVFDESGKISLNSSNLDEEVLSTMLENLGYEELEAGIVGDSILDWRDDNDFHRTNGAEDDYYLGLDRPYYCKDGDFDTVKELMLVRGVTREMFYGSADTPGLKEIFTAVHDSSRVTQNAISDAVEMALCGRVEDGSGEENDSLGASNGEVRQDLGSCLQDLGFPVRRNSRGRARVGAATIEARVKDPGGRVVSQVGTTIWFKGDSGFQALQWYDAVFDDEG